MGSFGVAFFATVVLSLVLCGYGGEQGVISSEEEDLELERQLRAINKPALKTIQTEFGDIIDCVDIYKQPAFDHSLLKNHKLQWRPSSQQHIVKKEALSLAKHVKVSQSNGCPSRSVPILRTTKADLIRTNGLNATNINPQTADRPGYHFSTISLKSKGNEMFYGAKSYIDVYNPKVEEGQSSAAQISIEAGPADQLNYIIVGWVVDPALYGDKRTRLFTYWTGDGHKKTGCYNLRCPGFVQVDKSVTLGEPLSSISTVNGDQFVMMAYVYQDRQTGNWWFVFTDDNVHVGYWPKELFPILGGGATNIAYGGRAQGVVNQLSPQMGSGLFPDGNYQHASFFQQVQFVNSSHGLHRLLISRKTFNDKPECYGLDDVALDGDLGYVFFFGGPGGHCGN